MIVCDYKTLLSTDYVCTIVVIARYVILVHNSHVLYCMLVVHMGSNAVKRLVY